MTATTKDLSRTRPAAFKEQQIAAVLENRFGNGCLYAPRQLTVKILDKASEMGFIDERGLLTRKGRALIARYT